MNPLLEAFLGEARDLLEVSGARFLDLEKQPDDAEVVNELFRAIHTIKGASGLFEITPFTQVIHAAEDVLDVVRAGELTLTPGHIDMFLSSMDQASTWLDDLETSGELPHGAERVGAELSQQMRSLLAGGSSEPEVLEQLEEVESTNATVDWAHEIPEAIRLECFAENSSCFAIVYEPSEQCFFQGHDPITTVTSMSGLKWFAVESREAWPAPDQLDPYRCILRFKLLAVGDREAVEHHLRYVPEEIQLQHIAIDSLVFPEGEAVDSEIFSEFCLEFAEALSALDWDTMQHTVDVMLQLAPEKCIQSSALRWMQVTLSQSSPNEELLGSLLQAAKTGSFSAAMPKEVASQNMVVEAAIAERVAETEDQIGEGRASRLSEDEVLVSKELLEAQRHVLSLAMDEDAWPGRVASATTIIARLAAKIEGTSQEEVSEAEQKAIQQASGDALVAIIDRILAALDNPESEPDVVLATLDESETAAVAEGERESVEEAIDKEATPEEVTTEEVAEAEAKGKAQNRTLRVDQSRIDALMDLVGQLVVAKNAMPYLAKKAEDTFGVKELARDIKGQHAVINRLADDLQHAVMQVRMVPVQMAFQRFPRLIRDLSRKLGKEVKLVVEGGETEADKNVVEDLSDPLIHLIRNSLDHGIETPDVRVDMGKPAQATILLRAIQKDDRVIIEVKDDGKGIDPKVIKAKALEKSLITEEEMDQMEDADALQLIFAAGFSTAAQVSDLSGRGVGMDVVRSAVIKAGGSVVVDSDLGLGSTVRLSLPLSMAVTRAMMVRIGNEDFGIPFEAVRETVRVNVNSIRVIKNREAVVLRDRLLPLYRLRDTFGSQVAQADELDTADVVDIYDNEEVAVLVVSIDGSEVGLVVDEFHEAIDIILKPLDGVMTGFAMYSGAALLGDGRVLLVLNLRELIAWL